MKPRTLEQICEKENFSIELLGNTYCGVGMNRKVECIYQMDSKDKNGLYKCMNPEYNKNDYNFVELED